MFFLAKLTTVAGEKNLRGQKMLQGTAGLPLVLHIGTEAGESKVGTK